MNEHVVGVLSDAYVDALGNLERCTRRVRDIEGAMQNGQKDVELAIKKVEGLEEGLLAMGGVEVLQKIRASRVQAHQQRAHPQGITSV